MSGDSVRILQITPPVGDGVQCKGIARDQEMQRWSQVVPLLKEIAIGKVPVGSVFAGYDTGWATFAAPDGTEMRFDLREPLKLHEAGQRAPDASYSSGAIPFPN